MTQNQEIVIQKAGEVAIREATIPKLRDDYILVKVKAVALNPTDWKHIDYLPSPGARVGCDYSGIVEEVGSKVTKPFKKGDRVAGFVHGSNAVNHDDGSFGNYIPAKGNIQIAVPDNLSFEEAATLGVGITTVGQGLYQSLELPLPDQPSSDRIPILIYGGSTATGSLAIQYAKLSGLQVITTCSPHNFEYVKSIGADAAFDYKSATCSEEIKQYTNDTLAYAFDCISEGTSISISVSSLSTSGGVYSTLLPVPEDTVRTINPKVTTKQTFAYTIVGEDFTIGGSTKFSANPQDFEFGKMFWEMSRGLLEEGKIKVHRPSVNKYGKGFEGIVKGLDALRQGKVSGEKLVFTL